MPQTKKVLIAAEDLYRFEIINYPRLSPNGLHVVYVANRVDSTTQKKYSNLWIAPAEGGKPSQFTFGDQKDAKPRWSPDGNTIAFLSTRGGEDKPAQIYLLPFHGGEARPLTYIEGEIDHLTWSPDGKTLLCTVRKTDAEIVERRNDELKKKLGVVSRHYDRVFYKYDGYGYLPHERTHLWTIDVKTGKARQITDHKVFDEVEPCWSPDSKSIAFISNRSDDPDFNPDARDLYVMPAKGGEFQKIETPSGDKGNPSFSPDGKWIAYYGREGVGQEYKNIAVWVVSTGASAAARDLTSRYDFHVSPSVINDCGEAELMPPTWSLNSQTIYFPVVLHGSSLVRSVSIQGDALQTLVGEGGAVGSFTFDAAQNKLAYFNGRLADPCQVQLLDVKSGKTTQLTQHNQEMLSKIDLGQIEEVWFKGPAGNDLQGWILTPPGFDPSKKYPSILEIHGGPITQYGKFFMHEFYYLAAHGYIVYFCNPRGGRGYGEEHTRAIWGKWGTADYDDLMAFTDLVAAKPYIDTERMGVTGGSYGGYMTLWIIGHTQRFKAAVSQRCVSNFISEWGSSDVNWTFQYELEAKQPFADLQKYWDMSPIKHIGKAKTPTLIIHNENDMRCPIEQGEQAYVSLKSIGVESEMVRFPDEFHGLSRGGRTDRRIARLNAILGWFERHLK